MSQVTVLLKQKQAIFIYLRNIYILLRTSNQLLVVGVYVMLTMVIWYIFC